VTWTRCEPSPLAALGPIAPQRRILSAGDQRCLTGRLPRLQLVQRHRLRHRNQLTADQVPNADRPPTGPRDQPPVGRVDANAVDATGAGVQHRRRVRIAVGRQQPHATGSHLHRVRQCGQVVLFWQVGSRSVDHSGSIAGGASVTRFPASPPGFGNGAGSRGRWEDR